MHQQAFKKRKKKHRIRTDRQETVALILYVYENTKVLYCVADDLKNELQLLRDQVGSMTSDARFKFQKLKLI